ncbi:hypothetical protein HOLleu_10379 [Holothuria leucospilota]|uniref:SWIM-type domain-containing protein n=1 Tax=Holothuria leucospilota TaxID=206669 RepID=A0A9Q1HET7_HOLLE|nr:hypothetical protein HOLleu_10379 [Holothuria leucospilota]
MAMLFLEQKMKDFNEKNNTICVKMETTADDQTIIAVCTPLMKRVHSVWKYSKEMVFVDSSGNMDRQNCRVFLFLTHSPAGSLPLGVVVTSSESQSTLTAVFKLLNSILPEDAFFGSADGPDVFMTDDCKALRMALNSVYPRSVLLLCVFHILQALWRWLWDNKNQVCKNDRPHLLHLFKDMVYAENEEDIQVKYQKITDVDEICKKYPKYIEHVPASFERRVSWSSVDRQELKTRGNNTTAYCEAAIRILKDKIFHRLKAYNICQLTDFILTHLEDYNIRKLTDISNNCLSANLLVSRFYPCAKDVQMESIDQVGDKEFRVRSAKGNEVYDVNMEIGICTCPSGRTGTPCKHQAAIMKKYGLDSGNFLPVQSPEMRKLYYNMATGESTVDERWFQPLHSGLLETNNSEEMISVEESECGTDAMADTETNTTSVGDQDPKIVCIQSLQAQAQLINQFGASQRNQTHQRNQEPILEEQLQNTFESLAASLRNDEGKELRNACKKFVSNYQKLTTRSHLISALQTFGKYSGAATSLRRTYKSGRALQTSSKIGVQPTAVARRKMPMGERRRLTVGRPSKSSFTSEHGYSKRALSLTRSSLRHGKKISSSPFLVTLCFKQYITWEDSFIQVVQH